MQVGGHVFKARRVPCWGSSCVVFIFCAPVSLREAADVGDGCGALTRVTAAVCFAAGEAKALFICSAGGSLLRAGS